MRIVVLLAAILCIASGCKKEKVADAGADIVRKYDADNDRTTVSTRPETVKSGEYTAEIHAQYSFKGSTLGGKMQMIDFVIYMKPTGPGLGEDVPFGVIVDGKNLTEGRTGITSTRNGERTFMIDFPVSSLGQVERAKSVVLAPAGNRFELSQAAIERVGKLNGEALNEK